MNRSTRHNVTYSIKVASILKMVLCTALLAVAGLSYVYFKNQEQQYGNIQRRLEAELARLHASNGVVNAQIASLSSRAFLEKKLAKDSLGLVSIANDQLVRLNNLRHDRAGDELRPVANHDFTTTFTTTLTK
jgi:cell division protein FtsB